jgi:bifunctional DNA-binding transcriptional regulator/antitoxin component of YhaV-PrlF toxin-antitoxin module
MELTVTSKGQFTLNKGLMEHLGIKPGEKVSVTKTPEGLNVAAVKNKLSIDEVLAGIDKIVDGRDMPSSIDDINHAIAEGYANAGMRGLE